MSIPSQSQSSPVIHFTKAIQGIGHDLRFNLSTSSVSFDGDDNQHLDAFVVRPQSTPISPRTRERIERNNNSTTDRTENSGRRLLNYDFSTLTNVTPLNQIQNQLSSKILLDIFKETDQDDRHLLRPPPLLVLSQSIQSKHPEHLTETKLNNRFSLKKDLPFSPANYSIVFYNFTQTKLDEARRLTRRMGNCFTSDSLDLVTTHLVLAKDSPNLTPSLEMILAIIHRCRLVTFEWLKSSSRIGDWLNEKKFQPKLFLKANPSLNIYRQGSRTSKPINLFQKCGSIYLTSTVQQRHILVKLISALGGDITVNRDRANIIVGYSSKRLSVIIQPQVNEQWIIDSILGGATLSLNDYLIDTNNCS